MAAEDQLGRAAHTRRNYAIQVLELVGPGSRHRSPEGSDRRSPEERAVRSQGAFAMSTDRQTAAAEMKSSPGRFGPGRRSMGSSSGASPQFTSD